MMMMVMTMMFQMMISTWHSTLCHSWQKEEVVLDMRVVTLRGRVNFWIIVLGRVLLFFSFEGCSEDIMYLFFSLFIRYIVLVHEVLWPFYRHTLYLFSLLYCRCMFFFHLPFHVLFLFSLYTHASYYLYAIYYSCFTQRCFDKFCLKCFRNTSCQSLLAINSFLAKIFKSLC